MNDPYLPPGRARHPPNLPPPRVMGLQGDGSGERRQVFSSPVEGSMD